MAGQFVGGADGDHRWVEPSAEPEDGPIRSRLGHDDGVIDVADVLQPELTEVNRLPARPPLTPYPDVVSARDGVGSPWRRSLDGAWRFRLVPSPVCCARSMDAPDDLG